jgi:hypothetical protein
MLAYFELTRGPVEDCGVRDVFQRITPNDMKFYSPVSDATRPGAIYAKDLAVGGDK